MTAFDRAGTEWQRVSPKYVALALVGDVVAVVLLAGVAVVLGFVTDWHWLALAWPLALAAVALVSACFEARRARAIGYRLRDDDLMFRRGLFFSRLVAVPYGRMQLVDVQQGPIARLLGLASVKMVTAAAVTGVAIPGLPMEEAERLRDHLIRLAESRRAGL